MMTMGNPIESSPVEPSDGSLDEWPPQVQEAIAMMQCIGSKSHDSHQHALLEFESFGSYRY